MQSWLALAVGVVCGFGGTARAQYAYYPVPGFGPANGPMVQVVNNDQQPDHCRSGIMGGAAVYFMRANFNDSTAFIITTNAAGADAREATEEFDWHYHAGVAGWLGWSSQCGVGFRFRGFHYDQASEPIDTTLTQAAAVVRTITPPESLSPLIGTPPRGFQSPGIVLTGGLGEDSLHFTSDLLVSTIDAEATFAHEWCRCGMVVSVGGRYCQIRQNYEATLVNIPVQGISERSFLDADRNFYGGGPTMSLLTRWQIGRSGLSVFGSVRGSILVGRSRATATFTEVIEDSTGLAGGNQSNVVNSRSDENVVVPVGEIEGGLEYSRAIGRTRFFVRGGAVNHTYLEAGSPSNNDGALNLFGGVIAFGLNY
jgi:hypothetical protein